MRTFMFEALSMVRQKFIGPAVRKVGQQLYVVGNSIEGEMGTEDRLVPSLRKLNYSGYEPEIQSADFVAPNATILGNVDVGEKSSIWYGATLIGTKSITIGDNSVVQDRTHLSQEVRIGNDVFVGPNSILQGSTLHNRAFVAMGATVRHATVETGGMVAAGAVVGDGVVIKEGEIWAGSPARFLRKITPVEREILREHLEEMKDLACIHSEETEKNAREVISGKTEPFESENFDDFISDMYQNPFRPSQTDEQFAEQRILLKENMKHPRFGKDYQPYEYDTSHLGEKFNIGVHTEQFRKVATKIKQKERFQSDTKPWQSKF